MVSGGWLAAAASDVQVAGPVVHVPVAPYLMPLTALSLPALGSFTSMTHHMRVMYVGPTSIRSSWQPERKMGRHERLASMFS